MLTENAFDTLPPVTEAARRPADADGLSADPSVLVEGVTVAFEEGKPVVADAALTVEHGQVLALLGPSGCGKTTLLRSIAGLQQISSGRIEVDGVTVNDAATFVAPERRRVGMVFQDGALFPHLSVSDNVAFGLRGRSDTGGRVSQVLDLVDMGSYGDRLPGTLSGGQRQRVALARALAPEPSVLLLDEPFSALDAGLRHQVRRDVKAVISQLGITTVVVTHDQEEAFAMGERVAVMHEGSIDQVGTPVELYRDPSTPWVAEFVGEGVRLRGQYSNGAVISVIGEAAARSMVESIPNTCEVELIVRPEELVVSSGDAGVIEDLEYYGHDVRYGIRLDDGTPASVRSLVPEFTVGDRVDVHFRGVDVPVWPIRR